MHYNSDNIFIESDFTNNLTTAQNFQRRLNGSDVFYNATLLIGNALDNVANSNIVSPQIQLNRNPSTFCQWPSCSRPQKFYTICTETR